MSFLLKRVPDVEKRLVAIPSSCYSSINLGRVCQKPSQAIGLGEKSTVDNFIVNIAKDVICVGFYGKKCDQICKIFAILTNFKSLANFAGFVVCSKILNVLWPLFYSVGQIFIVVNGQILKKQFNHLVTLIDSTVTVVKCMSLNILF